jgi:hypothetical protein
VEVSRSGWADIIDFYDPGSMVPNLVAFATPNTGLRTWLFWIALSLTMASLY